MSHALYSRHQIEEVDLTGDLDIKAPQNQTNHFDVQLYVLNHQQSLKNLTTIWHRDTDGSFNATEQLNPSLYHQDRATYLDRDDQVDHEWAEQKWQQWSERDFHPAVEAFDQYNEPSPEMTLLQNVSESLKNGDDAIKSVWTELDCAGKTLDLAVLPPNPRNPELLTAAMRTVFKDLAVYMRKIEKTQNEAKQQMQSLDLAVKALIRSKALVEKIKNKGEVADEKMIESVEFLKECLENHSRLVDIVLGRPEPLVQQGTQLMQNMLSEMFGLPVSAVQESVTEEEVIGECEEESDVDLELESESEVELLWETQTSNPQDFMDLEADESSGTESSNYDNENENSSEEFDYDDNISEHSNYSTTIASRTAKRLRKHKRDKARKARKALWSRFGLTLPDENEEEHRSKRQKKNQDTEEDLSNNPQVLKQTTLNFDKVSKSRRLFSRRELREKGMVDSEEEDADIASPGSMHRNSRRAVRVPPGYRSRKPKEMSSDGRHLTPRRFDR